MLIRAEAACKKGDKHMSVDWINDDVLGIEVIFSIQPHILLGNLAKLKEIPCF